MENGKPGFSCIILDEIKLDDMRKTVRSVTTCNVRTGSEKRPYRLTSACALTNGTIIATDNNNSRLIRLESTDIMLCVKDFYSLTGKPWSVCTVDTNEVAVSVPDKYLIQRFMIQDRFVCTGSLKLSHDFKTLAYNAGVYYVSGSGSTVYLYTTSGVPMRQFKANTCPGEDGAFFSHGMVVSKKGDVIFIAYLDKGLYAIDSMDGRVIWKRDGSELQCAGSVCADDDGGLYVCGNGGSHGLVQFSETGENLGSLGEKLDISNDISGLCYDSRRSRLIATHFEYGCVNIYQLG